MKKIIAALIILALCITAGIGIAVIVSHPDAPGESESTTATDTPPAESDTKEATTIPKETAPAEADTEYIITDEMRDTPMLFDVPPDFAFYVSYDGTEEALRDRLTVIDAFYEGSEYEDHETVVQPYTLTDTGNHTWAVRPVSPYDDGGTFLATVRDGVTLRDFEGDSLHFFTRKEEVAEAVLQDGVVFVKALELGQPGYYPYEITESDATDYLYVSLGRTDGIAVGDILCLGDVTTVDELLYAGENNYCIGKVSAIKPESDGRFTVILEEPALEEIFKELNIHGSAGVDLLENDPEAEQMIANAAVRSLYASEDFAEFLTSVSLASEEYLLNCGMDVQPLSAKSILDKLKIEVKAKPIENGVKVPITGKISIPIKKNGVSFGSIDVSFTATMSTTIEVDVNAEIDRGIFLNPEVKNFYFLVSQTLDFSFTFDIQFKVHYGLSDEKEDYIYNQKTKTVHDKDCPARKNVKDPDDLTYIDEKEMLSHIKEGAHECNRCQPHTRIQYTHYCLSTNQKTYHTVQCIHVADIHDAAMQITSMAMGQLELRGYTPCQDCHPEKREVREFENLMRDALSREEWAPVFEQFSIAAKKAGMTEDTDSTRSVLDKSLSFSVFTMRIQVDLVFDFDFQASFHYEYESATVFEYGIRQTHNGFEKVNSRKNPELTDKENPHHALNVMGEMHIKVGVRLTLDGSILHLNKWVNVGVRGDMGVYADAIGILQESNAPNARNFAAYRLEIGLYLELHATATLLKTGQWQLWSGRFPFLTLGYDRAYYAVTSPDEQLEVGYSAPIKKLLTLTGHYYDMLDREDKTIELNPAGKRNTYSVEYRVGDGTWCSIQNGNLQISPDAPDEFTDTLYVKVTGLKNGLDFFTGNGVFCADEFAIPLHYQKASSEGLAYKNIWSGGCAVVGIGTCTDRNIVIPPIAPNGRQVIRIETGAFAGCTQAESIVVPDTVKRIEDGAFADCPNLSSLTLGGRITKLGTGMIARCPRLVELTILDNDTFRSEGNCIIDTESGTVVLGCAGSEIPTSGVSYIGEGAFENCTGLVSISLPSNITDIKEHAFRGCTDLTEIHLPKHLNAIGASALRGCTALTTVYFKGTEELWASVEKGAEWDAETGAYELVCLGNLVSEGLKFTSNGDGTCSVSGIGTCTDQDIIIPETSPTGDIVTSIGSFAFENCSHITSVAIPDSVTSIEGSAFNYCSRLSSITIPDSVIKIGESAFYHCSSLTSIVIPNGVTSISSATFEGCTKLISVVLPDSLAYIDAYAFRDCYKLKKIYISDIAKWCNIKFSNFTGAAFEANPLYYADELYVNGQLANDLVVPDGVKSIGDMVFCGFSGLTSVSLPDSLTYIGNETFSNCSNLTSISIPQNVTYIGNFAFSGCLKLTTITIPEGVTAINYRTFAGCSMLTSISIPNSVTGIGSMAFYGCSQLSSIIIPYGVKSISDSTFHGCSNLESIVIPDSIVAIGDSAFEGCYKLSSISLPENLESIGRCAFVDCGITSIVIPSKVKIIDACTFCSCWNLQSVIIHDGITKIESGAFYGCENLTSDFNLENMAYIGSHAFMNCSQLKSVTISDKLISYGYGAFKGCENLTIYKNNSIVENNYLLGLEHGDLIISDLHYWHQFDPLTGEYYGY